MKSVTILAMYGTMASTVIGPMDVFYQAGVMWNYWNGQKLRPMFDLKLVTSNGKPFRSLNGVRMEPAGSIHDVGDTDLIMVSSIADIERVLQMQGEVVDWLSEMHDRGVHIATICSGSFVLAETGLLDGKTATTHWGFADMFRKRYPKVNLKPERIITDEGNLFCSGGFSAGMDLALYLVEKYYGHEAALESSRTVVFDIGRTTQAPYTIFQFQKDHGDDKVIHVQNWIEENFERTFTYEELAAKSNMSRRTLERRFKKATGDTPLIYQQRVRVEASKRMLETGNLSFDEITYKVGYEDAGSFRKVFFKQTGLLPSEYRGKFKRP